MDYRTVLEAVESWPMNDRVRLFEDLWVRLQEEGHEPDLTDDLKAELDRRIEEMDRNPKSGIPWEVVKARVLARHQG